MNTMSTSPRSLPEEDNHDHRPLRNHPNFDWTPPETDSESPPSPRHPSWPNQDPHASRFIHGPYSYTYEYSNRHHYLEPPYLETQHGSYWQNDNASTNYSNNIQRNATAVPQHHGIPYSSSFGSLAPHTMESVPGHSSPMVTAALSPMRSKRRARHHLQNRHYCHQQEPEANTRRRKIVGRKRGPGKTTTASFSRSRDVSILLAAHDLPSISSSSHSNKIYVRIKRVATEKSTKTTATIDSGGAKGEDRIQLRVRLRSTPPIPVPATLMHRRDSKRIGPNSSLLFLPNGNLSSSTAGEWNSSRQRTRKSNSHAGVTDPNHYTEHDEENVVGDTTEGRFNGESFRGLPSLPDCHRIVTDNSTFNLETPFPSSFQLQRTCSVDKFRMTQKLLALDNGPISWDSIQETGEPPDSFVWYLATVLTEGVQTYLEDNLGKEYWIKHVLFWSELLDPESHWWNRMREGLLYKEFARKLHTSLLRRWGGSDSIEPLDEGGSRANLLFVRACILFARKI